MFDGNARKNKVGEGISRSDCIRRIVHQSQKERKMNSIASWSWSSSPSIIVRQMPLIRHMPLEICEDNFSDKAVVVVLLYQAAARFCWASSSGGRLVLKYWRAPFARLSTGPQQSDRRQVFVYLIENRLALQLSHLKCDENIRSNRPLVERYPREVHKWRLIEIGCGVRRYRTARLGLVFQFWESQAAFTSVILASFYGTSRSVQGHPARRENRFYFTPVMCDIRGLTADGYVIIIRLFFLVSNC